MKEVNAVRNGPRPDDAVMAHVYIKFQGEKRLEFGPGSNPGNSRAVDMKLIS